jgi:hypothetical protein
MIIGPFRRGWSDRLLQSSRTPSDLQFCTLADANDSVIISVDSRALMNRRHIMTVGREVLGETPVYDTIHEGSGLLADC